MKKIRECAKTLRSKNCDPFFTTFDIFFENQEDYNDLKSSNIINNNNISNLYSIREEDVSGIYFLDNILALKITIKKNIPSSEPACKDVFGAHQHIMLAEMEF